jgi:uroporphyrinogen-III synthase
MSAPEVPLQGRRIAVTRPAAQAQALADLIRSAGGEPVCVPAIVIAPVTDESAFRGATQELHRFDLAVFVSRNAVERAFALLAQRDIAWPEALRGATVGEGSKAALEAHGLQGVLAPHGEADSEALLALPTLAGMRGRRVILFRGEGGRTLLADTLRSRGAEVIEAPCYRRLAPPAGALREGWPGGAVDAVSVSSAEGLANLCAMLGTAGVQALARTPLLVPHARVAREAERLGLSRIVVTGPGDAQVLAALVAYFSAAG